jgi:DNA-binding XRE family transcriptional regulator
MATKQHRLNCEELRRFTGATTQTQLAQIVGVRDETIVDWTKKGVPEVTADNIGVRDETIVDWTKKGVPEVTADNITIKLGVHPSAIWGDAWFALANQILAV